MKSLIIAEKPSVAKAIAAAMRGGKSQKGYIESDEWIWSWCAGHLVELEDASAYDERYQKWNTDDLPLLPARWLYKVRDDAHAQFDTLERLMNRSDVGSVVNACDAGREGELIFRLVYNQAGCTKSMKRLWISSMEGSAIRSAMENLRPGEDYDSLYHAALCRQQADWAVGINATRLFSCRFNARLSVGRVVTPTLHLLTERQQAMDTFKPALYWKVQLDLKGAKAVSARFDVQKEADGLAEACRAGTAEITAVSRESRKQQPPKLFDLTSLQREANRLFGMTAQQTLDTAQELYEARWLTYPRTDSRFLTDDMGDTAKRIVDGIRTVLPYLKGGGEDTARVLNSKKVTDHFAIIPTEEAARKDPSELDGNGRRIYELVASRLVIATGRPRLYTQTAVTVECAGAEFGMKGTVTDDPGWTSDEQAALQALKAKPDGDETDDGEDGSAQTELPDFTEHETFAHPPAEVTQHKTTPPSSFTEASLLAAMEKAGAKEVTENAERKGLGTPATRAGMIEKLVRSGLAERKGKKLIPTRTGMAACAVLPPEITSPSMTADWENRLARIADGREEAGPFMDGIYNYVRGVVSGNSGPVDPQLRALFASAGKKVVGVCPRCGCDVVENKAGWGCVNRDCKFMLFRSDKFFEWKKVTFTEKMAKDLLKNGKTFVKGLYSDKKDKTYDAYVLLKDPGEGYVKYGLEFRQDDNGKPKSKGGRSRGRKKQ